MFGFGKKVETPSFKDLLENILENPNKEEDLKLLREEKFFNYVNKYIEDIVVESNEYEIMNDNFKNVLLKILSNESLFEGLNLRSKIFPILGNELIFRTIVNNENNNHIVKHYMDYAYTDIFLKMDYKKDKIEMRVDMIDYYNKTLIGNALETFRERITAAFITICQKVNDPYSITNALIILDKNNIEFIKDPNMFINSMRFIDMPDLRFYQGFEEFIHKIYEPYELYSIIKEKNLTNLIPYLYDSKSDKLIDKKTRLLIDGLGYMYFPKAEYEKLDNIFSKIRFMKDLSEVEKIRDAFKKELNLNKEDYCPIEHYDLRIISSCKDLSKEDFNKIIFEDNYSKEIESVFKNIEI